MDKLPSFTSDGLLPPGDYILTLDQLKVSRLVLGFWDPKDLPTWDAVWREKLVDNLTILVRQLWHVGITHIFVNVRIGEGK